MVKKIEKDRNGRAIDEQQSFNRQRLHPPPSSNVKNAYMDSKGHTNVKPTGFGRFVGFFGFLGCGEIRDHKTDKIGRDYIGRRNY